MSKKRKKNGDGNVRVGDVVCLKGDTRHNCTFTVTRYGEDFDDLVVISHVSRRGNITEMEVSPASLAKIEEE